MAYDVNIQIVPASQYTGMGFYSFGQTRSLGVRGIQKLVNIFAKYLLTPVGTDPLDLTYGTNLTYLIGTNVSLNDAREVLDMAVDTAATAIRTFQSLQSSVDDDERLATAVVTDYIVIPDGPGFAAQVLITNVANQQLQIVLPTLEVRQ
jgi:alpha-D-ribose 1-methylphosphonate 5-phosphate C-P lyase